MSIVRKTDYGGNDCTVSGKEGGVMDVEYKFKNEGYTVAFDVEQGLFGLGDEKNDWIYVNLESVLHAFRDRGYKITAPESEGE